MRRRGPRSAVQRPSSVWGRGRGPRFDGRGSTGALRAPRDAVARGHLADCARTGRRLRRARACFNTFSIFPKDADPWPWGRGTQKPSQRQKNDGL